MTVRMSQMTPQVADADTTEESPAAPRVRIILTAVAGADLDAALSAVRRQVYEPSPGVVVVGDDEDMGSDVASARTLEEAISTTDADVDYLWLLHSDARPRPDALSALISETERNEASLAGSKLLIAGTMDELESVGGATDVFGEPYSGLDAGEIDLQQYDVVREVAFVQSASMLVRRDLARGLRGLDPLLPPVAAGLDFSQRTRLAGGKVISVPSSEVYHQIRCGNRGRGWREQAGRLRAMLIAYRPLTLLWVIPYDLMVSIVDSVASLLLLRWRPLARHVVSWAWNLLHIPSTIRQRSRLRKVRSEGDEELFRFHAKGSVRLREIGEEISGRALSVFDEDQALAKGSRRVWSSPGIWGAVVAVVVAVLAARSIMFNGMPAVGFAFPFEDPVVSLQRWFAGWNDAGLGSPSAVHPSVGITGLVSLLWLGASGAARTLMTLAFIVTGVIGVGRLVGRIGLRGPGRYLAGLVVLAGPGTAALAGRGSWLALGAAATLPWAIRSAFIHPHEYGRSRFTYTGWALLTGLGVAFFSPLLVVVPLLTVVLWRLFGGDRGSFMLALVGLVGGAAGAAFVLGDPGWITDSSRRLDVAVDVLWPAALIVAAVPLLFTDTRHRTLGLTGGVLSMAAISAATIIPLPPGAEEAVLILASLGAALVVSAAFDTFSRNPLRLAATLGAVAILIMSIGTMGNGRLGLPSDDVNERLAYAVTLAGDAGPGRLLLASIERDRIPGEARSGPGFWYRVVDGSGTTHNEVWLPPARDGDTELDQALAAIASGGEMRPGARLASFAIDWVVLEGPPFRLDDALAAQLDLIPRALDPDSRVFENPTSAPLAGTPDIPWRPSGTGFAGDPVSGEVPLAVSFHRGWQPNAAADGWAVTVDGGQSRAWYEAPQMDRALPIATIVLVVASLLMIGVGSRKGK
jgi:GT2 family glycosyltransferase